MNRERNICNGTNRYRQRELLKEKERERKEGTDTEVGAILKATAKKIIGARDAMTMDGSLTPIFQESWRVINVVGSSTLAERHG